MPLNIDDSRADLISKLDALIDQKLPAAEGSLVKSFLDQYYLGVSPYDLREKTLDELYGALLSHWHFAYQRMPGESKIRIFNPRLEESGWQSTHTIIEIVHENKPFLLDTLRLALKKLDINVRLIIQAEGIRFERNAKGEVTKIIPLEMREPHKKEKSLLVSEAPIYIEIDRQSDNLKLQAIKNALIEVLKDVDIMVSDWGKMLEKLTNTITLLQNLEDKNKKNGLHEVINFMRWLSSDNFTFIGCAEYNYEYQANGHVMLNYITGSGLGVLNDSRRANVSRDVDNMYPDARRAVLGPEVLLLGKTDTESTVHRPAYTDFAVLKFFDDSGKPVKAIRFVGLYTSIVYNESVENIPYIRKKVARVFEKAAFPKSSHDGRSLLHIIQTLPRDEVFQATEQELYDFSIGILHLQERQRIKLFMRRDIYGRYFSCLVFVPRDLFTAQLRNKMQDVLMQALSGQSVDSDTQFSASILARIHFIIRVKPDKEISYDPNLLELQLIEASRTWSDDLHQSLNEQYGEEKANELYKIYADSFPISYREIFTSQTAVADIKHMEILRSNLNDTIEMSLYRPIEDPEDSFRFKLFRYNQAIPLSDVVPILENMGLRIISERPHEIKLPDHNTVWITDYRMVHPKGEILEPEHIKDDFQEAFSAIWSGFAENDRFNRLVLNAKLGWRDISIIRAYYRYLWQTGLVFSQSYVEDALYNNSLIAKKLIEYFYVKFNPLIQIKDRDDKLSELKKEILNAVDAIIILNEDRIIRSLLGTLEATMRTNFFQLDAHGWHKNYLSLKFDSGKVPDLPLPKPLCEIFVYSTQVEAIHLRGDRVARGGIRWSDRREDFRTEVLGLMKAQQVKNAVIVPLGAKGGFVVKRDLLTVTNRDERNAIVIECYKTFMRGILDITDNYEGEKTIKPENTICWDKEDPYLVVAADKGTATFSDIANAIAGEYNFWLGDAFASGGSTGYDHKKMAITARGAWESVKLHFKLLAIDVQTEVITVIGIGDMAGDVFGNGMLQSNKLKLIAAFNHLHIFFDPDPDVEVSYQERARLFALPTSTWRDYNPALISPGGGVFDRSAKKITITPEMQKVLRTTKDSMEPNQLLREILMMHVDLFFNGGIGTFVKSSVERNTEVGDRANDAIRIDGNQLNARVVCEGGNLGFTQLARIEYAQKGGIINTDAIDNSGGVNCSDTEVNIKILLDQIIDSGDLTTKQRNELLVSMTDEVAELVLANNRKQNCALILAENMAPDSLQMHYRLLKELERDAGLDPAVSYLPDGEEITLRLANKKGFTRPELAVLMAYTKIQLKRDFISSNLPDDPYVERDLIYYFPRPLQTPKFIEFIKQHRLKRAIISTRISNYIVNEMGINFMQRLIEETGETSAQIARGYMIAREVFNVKKILSDIWQLGGSVTVAVQLSMWQDLNRLIRRTTRWFVRNIPSDSAILDEINKFKPLVSDVQHNLDLLMQGAWLDQAMQARKIYMQAGVPVELATTASKFNAMFAALDIVQAALENNLAIDDVGKAYFAVGARLKLGWFGDLIKKQPVKNYWEALARAGFRDDVEKQQRNLAVSILQNSGSIKDTNENIDKMVEVWLNKHPTLLQRWEFFVDEFKTSEPEFTMFAVALRELIELLDNVTLAIEPKV
jgi:glutamate dehydrogenase